MKLNKMINFCKKKKCIYTFGREWNAIFVRRSNGGAAVAYVVYRQ